MDKLQGTHLLGSVPVPARENTDKQKGEKKVKCQPSVSVSLLRYNADNNETQSAVYVALLKGILSFKVS